MMSNMGKVAKCGVVATGRGCHGVVIGMKCGCQGCCYRGVWLLSDMIALQCGC